MKMAPLPPLFAHARVSRFAMFPVPSFFSACRHPAMLLLVSALAACGGGGGDDDGGGGTPTTGDGTTLPDEVAQPPADQTCGFANFQAEMLQRVNAARTAGAVCGSTSYPAASALRWNAQLQQAAARHSADMAANNFVDHPGSDGSSQAQRVQATGYTYTSLAENVAGGQRTVQEVVDAWMKSAGHCQNIMNANLQDMGVACVRKEGTTYTLHWTMNLGRPR